MFWSDGCAGSTVLRFSKLTVTGQLSGSPLASTAPNAPTQGIKNKARSRPLKDFKKNR